VLAILTLSQFMVTVDVTIVTVAYPHIQRTLHIPDDQLQWITVAYTLAFGGFLVLAGRTGDVFGKRRLWLAGLAVFTTASLACAVAQGQWEMLVARGAQGLGAAFVVPSALALLNSTFEEGPARNTAIAIWSAIASAGALTGYALGGLITGLTGRRWRRWARSGCRGRRSAARTGSACCPESR
jgi:MFS family permease